MVWVVVGGGGRVVGGDEGAMGVQGEYTLMREIHTFIREGSLLRNGMTKNDDEGRAHSVRASDSRADAHIFVCAYTT